MSSRNLTICGTDLYHQRNLLINGDRYRKNRSLSEKNTLRYMGQSSRRVARNPIMTIPVVVHVIYHEEIENISYEQIHSQINRLNRDFRKMNGDIIKVPDPWKKLAADTRIEFRLACKGPDGNPSNGITRTYTNETTFNLSANPSEPEKIKFTSLGGKDAWDPSRYLNIWVCNLGDGLLGYAQFPDGDPNTDGVVIAHWVFGDTGSALSENNPFQTSFNMGRTATHEIGHYLNCYHIWGDEMFGTDPCSAKDNVEDTPNQRGSNTGKPTFPSTVESCDDTGINGTMFMNYMDYTDDDCMFMFTIGQAVRMHSVLETSRSSLLVSDVLNCPIEEQLLSDVMVLPSKVFDGVDENVDIVEKL